MNRRLKLLHPSLHYTFCYLRQHSHMVFYNFYKPSSFYRRRSVLPLIAPILLLIPLLASWHWIPALLSAQLYSTLISILMLILYVGWETYDTFLYALTNNNFPYQFSSKFSVCCSTSSPLSFRLLIDATTWVSVKAPKRRE